MKLTHAQIAKKAGVTRQAVSASLKRGKTVGQIIQAKRHGHNGAVGRPDEGAIKGIDSKGVEYTATAAEIRNKLAVAEKNEVDLAKMRGELVPLAPLRAWYSGITIRARDIIMGIEELADRIRQAPDEIEARLLIRNECTRAMQELGRYARFTVGEFAGSSKAPPNAEPMTAIAAVEPVAKVKAKAKGKRRK